MQVNDEGKITAARDLVEPPFKSGAAALQVLPLSVAGLTCYTWGQCSGQPRICTFISLPLPVHLACGCCIALGLQLVHCRMSLAELDSMAGDGRAPLQAAFVSRKDW